MIDALLLATALAASASATPFQGVVLVRHHGIEEPVGGAVVELRSDQQPAARVLSAVTASDGTFDVPNVSDAQYWIEIRSNYDPIGGLIDIIPDEVEPRRKFIVLDPACWAAYGKVRDSTTGDPVANATIDYLGTGVSDKYGNYFIDWGCGPVAFRFHNSFFIYAIARGYNQYNFFAGRAEDIRSGMVRDFKLQPRPGHPPCCANDPERRIP